MQTLEQAQSHSFLLTNGLGGYVSASAAFSVPRSDQGILIAAVRAPNARVTMVHRLRETLRIGQEEGFLSTQSFADGSKEEDGYRHLAVFSLEYVPSWTYQVSGVQVIRRCCMAYGKNTAAVVYSIENRSEKPCTLHVTPFLKFAPKELALKEKKPFSFENGRIVSGDTALYVRCDGTAEALPECWQTLSYPEDAKDGRPEKGLAAACCCLKKTVLPGQSGRLEIVFSMEEERESGWELLRRYERRQRELERACPIDDPVARQLARSADAFIARRDSTGEKTILAGYPLFSDWGRDTMISLTGCTLATGRYEDARSILRTFLAYEKDGLVPNLFPEGEQEPMYNTADAALLLIDGVWQYVCRTGDLAFAAEAFPVMERIITGYRNGTHHAVYMDTDGLIHAGSGMDQVTWMDVCVQGILPTPRHGKPVEINAYWYNALRIMELLSEKLGRDGDGYGSLAEKVKQSFVHEFYMEKKGCLRDVISGTGADEQIRCNQIWAVSMHFTMLSPEQERRVVETVCRTLYTPCGLRTLSPSDPEYQGFYGGDQLRRDLAYHQGTVWVFPLGAYYLAYLKTRGYSPEAAGYVRGQLEALEPMLREGCAGQLPEIYDGDQPTAGKGCFAQAWSVGEMLRVYEVLDRIHQTGETERSW